MQRLYSVLAILLKGGILTGFGISIGFSHFECKNFEF